MGKKVAVTAIVVTNFLEVALAVLRKMRNQRQDTQEDRGIKWR
jgi:hypothetical protein